MAGFVQRKVVERFKCPECIDFLLSSSLTGNVTKFTKLKDKGGLVYSHPDVMTIVMECDRFIRSLLTSSSLGPFKVVNDKFILKLSINVIQNVSSKISLPDHAKDIEAEDTHPVQLIKFICKLFGRTIMHHHAKIFTERFINSDKGTIRHSLNKKVLFLHQ